MPKSLQVSQCSRHGSFIIRFHNNVTSLTANQMTQLIFTLDEVCDDAVELGWIQAFQDFPISCCTKPSFKLCMGRIILILSHLELVDLMTQLWKICPSLMKYATEGAYA